MPTTLDAAIESLRRAISEAIGESSTPSSPSSPSSPGPAPPDDETARRQRAAAAELAQAEKRLEISEAAEQTAERISYQEELKLELRRKQAQLEYEMNSLTAEQLGQKLAVIREEEKELELVKKRAEEEKKMFTARVAAFKAGLDMTQRLGASLTGYANHPIFNVSNIVKIGAAFKKAASKGVLPFVAGLATGIVSGFLNMVVSLIFQIDKFEKAITKATDGTGEFARATTAAYKSNRAFAVSMESNSAAAGALYAGMTNLSMASATVQTRVIDTAAVLVQMGVAAGDAEKGFQFFNKVANQSPTGAIESMTEMHSLARNLGVPVQQLMSDFAQMSPELAKLGKEGERAFKELARVSKITGLEMKKLLTLTDKFDTFEGAAEMAGKLNAALGGNFVNAMDMMTATDPVERFEMLRGALDDAGLSFDDMSYYQRKFYAEQMGMSVQDLAMAMSGDMGDLSKEVNMTSADYKEMADHAKKMATFQDKLQAVFSKFVPILEPIIDDINKFIDGLGTSDEISRKIEPTLMGLADAFMFTVAVLRDYVIPHWELLVVVMGLKFLGILGPLISGIGRLATVLLTRLIPAVVGFFTTTATTSVTLAEALPFVIGYAAAIFFAGVGIGFAATGMAILIQSITSSIEVMPEVIFWFGVLTAVGLVAAFGLMKLAVTTGFMGAVAKASAGPIMGVGIAVMAMGAGMLLGALAFSVFADAVEGIVNADMITMMGRFTLGVFGLAAAVFLLGKTSMSLLPIFAALAAVGGIAAMIFGGDEPAPVDTETIDGYTKSLNAITPSSAEAAATATERISDAINGLNPLNAFAVNAVLDRAITWGEVTGVNALQKAQNATKAQEASSKTQTTQSSTGTSNKTATLTPLTVNVMLNRDKLGVAVVELMGEYSNVLPS